MSTTSQRIAHAIIRLYPRRWRARYETELIALVEDTGATAVTIGDLVLGAVDHDALAPTNWHPRQLLPLWMRATVNGYGVFAALEFGSTRSVAWRQYLKRQRQQTMMNPPTGLSSGL